MIIWSPDLVSQSEKTITELEILFRKVIHPKEPFHLFRASFFVPYNIELLVAPFFKNWFSFFKKISISEQSRKIFWQKKKLIYFSKILIYFLVFVWKMGLTSDSITEKQIGCAVVYAKMILEIPDNLRTSREPVLGCLDRVNSISVEFSKNSLFQIF